MILTRRYNFDIVPGGPPLLIRASRNDTSSTLVFSLGSLTLERYGKDEGCGGQLAYKGNLVRG